MGAIAATGGVYIHFRTGSWMPVTFALLALVTIASSVLQNTNEQVYLDVVPTLRLARIALIFLGLGIVWNSRSSRWR